MNRTLLVSLICLFLNILNSSVAQPLVDSLRMELEGYKLRDTVRVNRLNKAAYQLFTVNLEQIPPLLEEAILLADSINYDYGKAEGTRILGLYYYYHSDFDIALDLYDSALKVNKRAQDHSIEASCLNNSAVIYYRQGNYPRALDFYQRALRIFEQNEDQLGIGRCLDNIAIIHSEQKDYKNGIEYFQQSLELRRSVGDESGIGTSLNNIGELYFELEEYDQANTYFIEALAIKEKVGDQTSIASILRNIGLILLEKNDLNSAIDNFSRALEVSESIGFKYGMCMSYIHFGTVYLKKGDLNLAKQNTNKGLHLATELSLLDEITNAHSQLSEIYAAEGSFRKAYDHHVLFTQYNDSIFNSENIKRISDLENKYLFEKEKQQILFENEKEQLVLTEDNKRLQERAQYNFIGLLIALTLLFIIGWFYVTLRQLTKKVKLKNEQLKQYDNEKNLLIGLVAHDLMSPINNIMGLTGIVLSSEDGLQSDNKKYLGYIQQTGQRLSHMIRRILDVSAIEAQNLQLNMEEHDLSEILQGVAFSFQSTLEKKGIKLSVSNTNVANAVAKVDKDYLIQVLENLVSNAIKFSKPNTEVKLLLSVEADTLTIRIQDEGPGISEEDKKKLFGIYQKLEAKPTDGESSTGLGLSIAKKYVEAMDGEISVQSELGEGTTFLISFPRG
ncbi:ATP-binding protein [Reichenbachiella versicolor]|uniref:ATP-binding protein n=1 Tax=Reichenbachiella versicolor TaxID=1821036 RepID=UPI000D6E953F|nr:tetratricopeptide repeat protein [Reichenbachiella versicolor]